MKCPTPSPRRRPISPRTPAIWLRTLLIVIAVVEGLEGLFKIPLVIERDPVIFGKGWGSYAVGAELVAHLAVRARGVVLSDQGRFPPRHRLRRRHRAAALDLAAAVGREPSGLVSGLGLFGLSFRSLQIMVFPLLMLMVIALACKNERLTLAGTLASLPAVTNWLGIVAFGIGVAIYGF